MRILVTGGAGFIGSHVVLALAKAGHHPVTVDNLSNGHRDAILAGDFYRMDIRDVDALTEILSAERIEAVIHLAGLIEAGLSVADPVRFEAVNIGGARSLLSALQRTATPLLLFSSTAAIFGNPHILPVDEEAPHAPVNPYGHTKLAVERLLAEAEAAWGLRSVALRYFNAAGADPGGRLGERHQPETHLIPLALAVAMGRLPHLKIFGTDYPTTDGTCVRDYVHVADLASAHLAALDYLAAGGPSGAFNLGNGLGFSVRQVIEAVERVTGRPVPVQAEPRRPGDPAALVASSRRARRELDWQPRYTTLEDMVAHAWAFQRSGGGRVI